jgi:hypothetical protein
VLHSSFNFSILPIEPVPDNFKASPQAATTPTPSAQDPDSDFDLPVDVDKLTIKG